MFSSGKTPAKPMPAKRATRKRRAPASKRPVRKATTRRKSTAPSAKPKPLNRLTVAQTKDFEAWSNAAFQKRKQIPKLRALAGRPALRQFIVVAEGDSWFDYKPAYIDGKDLLGHLQTSGRINVYRVSKAGDTLENMVYGTDTTGHGPGLAPKLPPQIEKTLAAIRNENADAFFFSGGGNDLAGVELAGYLNHKDWGAPTLRSGTLDYIFGIYFEKALTDLIAKVHLVKPGLPIFLHGYDYAVPDGRDVGFLGFSFAGPWLKPALTQKRYLPLDDGRKIMMDVLDRFNAALKRVADAHKDVHFIKLLGTLRNGAGYKNDWANELHPTSRGFKTLANVIEESMLKVLQS